MLCLPLAPQGLLGLLQYTPTTQPYPRVTPPSNRRPSTTPNSRTGGDLAGPTKTAENTCTQTALRTAKIQKSQRWRTKRRRINAL
nr:E4 protein - human papillomavirus type 1a [Human papillomavirus type 1a]